MAHIKCGMQVSGGHRMERMEGVPLAMQRASMALSTLKISLTFSLFYETGVANKLAKIYY